jgi:hypothetical protein
MSGVANKLMSAAGGVVGPAWDLSYAYYDGLFAWDISSIAFRSRFDASAQSDRPSACSLSPDGTKMYVLSLISDTMNEYTLSSAWQSNSASFVQSFNVGAQVIYPTGAFFRADGLKMYVCGNFTGGDGVAEYNLNTAWDISSSSFVHSFSTLADGNTIKGVFFKPDGTKMYVVSDTDDEVNEYNLSSAWDVSSASYFQRKSISAQTTAPSDIFIKPDGTRMYITDVTDVMYEYRLNTPWDLTPATYLGSIDISQSNVSGAQGFFFKPDGTALYIAYTGGIFADYVYQFSLGGFSVNDQEIAPNGLFFKPDGTKMYVAGSNGDDVNEYNLSREWDLTSATFSRSFSVAAQEIVPTGLFFKPDGTKMYLIGSNGDDVNEYNLSTAWRVDTATFSQNFSVAAQETNPQDVFFKPDGTKMYVVGITSDDVNEYNLSLAWDISSASFVQGFRGIGNPSGVFFKYNGTKMYLISASNDNVNEYDLSTAWNVSTASFSQSFNIADQEPSPQAVFFKPDGTQMFIVGTTSDAVHSYTLGIQE